MSAAAPKVLGPKLFPPVQTSLGSQVEEHILGFLDCQSLARFSTTNKLWNRLTSGDKLWEGVVKETIFPSEYGVGEAPTLKGRFALWMNSYRYHPRSEEEMLAAIKNCFDQIKLNEKGRVEVTFLFNKHHRITVQFGYGYFDVDKPHDRTLTCLVTQKMPNEAIHGDGATTIIHGNRNTLDRIRMPSPSSIRGIHTFSPKNYPQIAPMLEARIDELGAERQEKRNAITYGIIGAIAYVGAKAFGAV